jgi:two-component system, response regulator PdtaR
MEKDKRTIKILIVEDEAIVALDLKTRLAEMGYSGFSVSSGKNAIRKISRDSEQVDLILMDVTLKDNENGIHTARAIRKLRKIPIIFITAVPRSVVLEQVKGLTLTKHIRKPYSQRDLEDSIRELLEAA